MWKVIKERTKDHWLELEDEENQHEVIVKWDGCIHFTDWFFDTVNDKREENYIHICDIDSFIKSLEALRDEAKKHFGNDWPPF